MRGERGRNANRKQTVDGKRGGSSKDLETEQSFRSINIRDNKIPLHKCRSVKNNVSELEALRDDLILLTEADASLHIKIQPRDQPKKGPSIYKPKNRRGGLLVCSQKGAKVSPIDNCKEFSKNCIFNTGIRKT